MGSVDPNENVHFLKINSNSLKNIYDILPMKDLFKLSLTCKRFYVSIQYYVTNLQVIVDDRIGALNLCHLEKNHVVLDEINPLDFLYPNPPFQRIERLYLNFDGSQCGKINLTALKLLSYLKIRGPKIELSSNRLPSVKEIDLEDVDTCERQVFINMKKFIVNFDLEELSQIYNLTNDKTLERVRIKLTDILTDKKYIEYVKIVVNIDKEIGILNKFTEHFEKFLEDYELYIDEGKIDIVLKHAPINFQRISNTCRESDILRGEFKRLQNLSTKYYNLKVIIEKIKRN